MSKQPKEGTIYFTDEWVAEVKRIIEEQESGILRREGYIANMENDLDGAKRGYYRGLRAIFKKVQKDDPKLSARKIAALIGKSHAWVNDILKWKGRPSTLPFEDAAKAKQKRAHRRAILAQVEKMHFAQAEKMREEARERERLQQEKYERERLRGDQRTYFQQQERQWEESVKSPPPEIGKADPPPDRDRLAKLILMLSSKNDGEVLNAARLICQLYDIHGLAEMVRQWPEEDAA